MPKHAIMALAVVTAVLLPNSTLSAQAIRPFADSTIAELTHDDSTSRLTLTTHHVVFDYTARGVDRARSRADSTTDSNADRGMARLVRESVIGAFQDMRFEFDISAIANAEAVGRTVLVHFKATRSDSNNPRDTTFDFDSTDARAAQSFATRLNELVAARR